jgi:hypothetical protein
LTSPF